MHRPARILRICCLRDDQWCDCNVWMIACVFCYLSPNKKSNTNDRTWVRRRINTSKKTKQKSVKLIKDACENQREPPILNKCNIKKGDVPEIPAVAMVAMVEMAVMTVEGVEMAALVEMVEMTADMAADAVMVGYSGVNCAAM